MMNNFILVEPFRDIICQVSHRNGMKNPKFVMYRDGNTDMVRDLREFGGAELFFERDTCVDHIYCWQLASSEDIVAILLKYPKQIKIVCPIADFICALKAVITVAGSPNLYILNELIRDKINPVTIQFDLNDQTSYMPHLQAINKYWRDVRTSARFKDENIYDTKYNT